MKQWFGDALFCDTLRGGHGTGVFSIDQKNRLFLYKRAMAAPDFVQLKLMEKWSNNNENWKCVVGHNRYATIANSISDRNAHPFKHGRVVGVHNGTLNYKYRSNDFEVDSDGMYDEMSKHHNTEKELLQYLSTVQGSYALVWYNISQKCLYLTRNEDRPLFYGFAHGGDSILFASETWLIRALAERNGLTLLRNEKLDTDLYRVRPGQLIKVYDEKPAIRCKCLKYELYKEPKSNYTSNRNYSHTYRPNQTYDNSSALTGPNNSTGYNSYSNPVRVNNQLKNYDLVYGDLVTFKKEKVSSYGPSVYVRLEGVYNSPKVNTKAKVVATGIPSHKANENEWFQGRVTDSHLCLTPGYDIEIEVRSVDSIRINSNVIKLPAPAKTTGWRGPGGVVLSGKQAKKLWRDAGEKCCYCQKDIPCYQLKLPDGDARWTNENDELLCGKCVQEMLQTGLSQLISP